MGLEVLVTRKVTCQYWNSALNVACTGETKNVHRVLVGKPEGQKKIESRSCRWKNNIKTVVKKMGLEGVGVA